VKLSVATQQTVPLVRLDAHDPELLEELLETVASVAGRAAFTLGEEVHAFEEEFASWCGARHAVGVSSGTDALVLALRVLGIGPGDEVIVPSNSFIASAEAVALAGARPVLVDVDEASGLLTAEIVERSIGTATRCVIPVHLYGATVNMAPLVALAREAGIAVVEDACQAHGAELLGGRAGTLGDLGCFSFYPTKNLGGWGDGGAVVTSDDELAERLTLLRSHGESPRHRNRHRVCGTTARLDGLQAAVLRVKLRRLEGWNETRRNLAAALTDALGESQLELPSVRDGGDHVFHLYVVQTDWRDELRVHLADLGIASAVHYPVPIHSTEAFRDLATPPLRAVERRAGRICSLPFHPSLTPAEIDYVADAVRSFERKQRRFMRVGEP
jgi:dTDP-3-amino-3,4,6-trideoxy-alpha-D-glucose transaminase